MGTGTFVTFEGIDGCGKSTQLALLMCALAELGVDAEAHRDPGGTAISEKIRSILLDPANAALCAQAELLLYEASRAQLVCEAIEPALARGAVVVCDRFYDSTFAYQSGARGIDEATVRAANTLGSCGYTPDLTLVFDLDPERALRRATRGGADRLEAEGACFQRRVREGYRRMVALEPGRVRMVDADGTPEEVFARTALALVPAIRALSSLDVPAFLARQADVERMMGTIAPSVEEGPHA